MHTRSPLVRRAWCGFLVAACLAPASAASDSLGTEKSATAAAHGSGRQTGVVPAGVTWSVDLGAALAEARASQRLVLVCFNMDGEQANERALEMYRSPDFAAAAADVICVLCSADEHDGGDVVCSRFGTCTCREHRDSERKARRHFFGGLRENIAPQHILLYPDGIVAWHGIYETSPRDLFRAIEGSEKLKKQALAQRLRGQRAFLDQTSRRASKGVTAAYMQVQARLAQTPAEHFLGSFEAVEKGVAERILHDLRGYDRSRSLAWLKSCGKHSKRGLRELAAAVAAEIGAVPEGGPSPHPDEQRPAAANSEPEPLTSALSVLGPADDFGRVHWHGADVDLDACRNRVTLIWFFLHDAPDLAQQVEEMNEFVASQGNAGVQVLGLSAALRPSDVVDAIGGLGCTFRVGAYQATRTRPLFGVERFPTWVVLDPDANVVHRSPQDGSSFVWNEARTLAARIVSSAVYRERLAAGASRDED